jgi:hypothetical protein
MKHVFIVGCGNSGTTLLTAMLGAHSRIYSIPVETGAFIYDGPLGLPNDPLAPWLHELNKPTAVYICEKTPAHIHRAPQILSCYPEARFIVMVRDPRDVACSARRRGFTINDAVTRWSHDNNTAILLLRENQSASILTRYEDLVAHPEQELTRLCNFLGVTYKKAMQEFWRDGRHWMGVTQYRETPLAGDKLAHLMYRNWQVHQPLMTNTVGIYRHELAYNEVTLIEQALRLLAARLGYSFDEKEITFGTGSLP